MNRRAAGFTLLEVLVALIVLGFVLAGLAQATQFGIHAWSLETRLADTADAQERTDRVLRLLFNQARPPMSSDDKPFTGEEHKVLFVTQLPDQPPAQPIRRAQVAIGVDDDDRLVIRWQPHPNAIALKTLDPPHTEVLANDVERIDFSYRQAAGDGGKWQRTWTDESLPALVQIHLKMKAKRQWPDLVIPLTIDENGTF